MSGNAGSPPGAVTHDPFEIAVRGYSRSQVDEFTTRVGRRIKIDAEPASGQEASARG
jgi:cell division septum initiation protein DivIVA